MVSFSAIAVGYLAAPLAVAAGTLDRDDLAASYAAIVLVSFLGLVMVMAVIVGARHVRRLNRRPVGPSQMVSDRWYEKPLVNPSVAQPGDESVDVE